MGSVPPCTNTTALWAPNSGDIRHEWPWENPVPGGVQLSKNVRVWIVNRNDITVTFECRKRIFTSNVANRHVKLESTKTEPLQPSSEFLGLRDKARWLLEGGLGLYLHCRWCYASPPHCNAVCKKSLYSLSSFRTLYSPFSPAFYVLCCLASNIPILLRHINWRLLRHTSSGFTHPALSSAFRLRDAPCYLRAHIDGPN